MRILVYKYGLLAPIENGDMVFDQIRNAHAYRNKLTEITRIEREGLRNIERKIGDMSSLEKAVAAADAQVAESLKAIKASRARTHMRTESKAMREALNAAKKVKRDAVDALRKARAELRTNPKVQAAKEKNHEKRNLLQRRARAQSNVYWGTYLLVEAADQSSQKMPLFQQGEPVDPHYQRWTGEGQLGIQVQKGINASRLFSSVDTRIRVDEQEHVFDKPPVSEKVAAHRERLKALRNPNSKRKRGVLSIRIGSETKGRAPIWAKFPIILHRPFPEGAKIKTVSVSRRSFGPKVEWSCEFTIEVPDVVPVVAPATAVSVDLGWRKLSDGTLRVGTWVGSDGQEGHWILPPRIQSAMVKVEGLRSLRDKLMNEMKGNFSAHLAKMVFVDPNVTFERIPKWMMDAVVRGEEFSALSAAEFVNRFSMWRSQSRFASLAHKWKENRFPGDEEAYGCLEAWRYQDYHLWAWESGTRRSTLRYRKDFYRNIAAKLASTYGTIILEDIDLVKLARAARPGEKDSVNETANANRFLVSPSELKTSISLAVAARGRTLSVENAKDTTKKCHSCGKLCEWDQSEDLTHTCENCGVMWDQDINASRNLLKDWTAANPEGVIRTQQIEEITAPLVSKRHALRMTKKLKKSVKEDLSQTPAQV